MGYFLERKVESTEKYVPEVDIDYNLILVEQIHARILNIKHHVILALFRNCWYMPWLFQRVRNQGKKTILVWNCLMGFQTNQLGRGLLEHSNLPSSHADLIVNKNKQLKARAVATQIKNEQ